MSIIERAANRLEELRRAGVEIPAGVDTGQRDTKTSPPGSLQRLSDPISVSSHSHLENPLQSSVSVGHARFDLDLRRLAASGFITPDLPRSRMADEFRVIKRPLLANASEKRKNAVTHSNLILVTSSVPGEGKTFTAVNLAMSVAMEVNKTVLLVDGDVARPSFPRVLGIPPDSKGLLDLLGDEHLSMSDVLLGTNLEKLTILPSGTPHPHATELLASNAMTRLLEGLAANFTDRIVVFDSPPLLVTTEARVLATQMGQVVFVVNAESTLQSDVKRALVAIESCPIRMLVLNQARTVAQGAYGYGYGYGT